VAASFAVASLALETCALIALAPKKLAASIFLPAGFDDACVCGRVLEVDVSGMVWRPRESACSAGKHAWRTKATQQNEMDFGVLCNMNDQVVNLLK
jgi:hypothetical protein